MPSRARSKRIHPSALPKPEMDTVCRDCGRAFAGMLELVHHYDRACRAEGRTVAAGSRHRPNNVVPITVAKWRVRR